MSLVALPEEVDVLVLIKILLGLQRASRSTATAAPAKWWLA